MAITVTPLGTAQNKTTTCSITGLTWNADDWLIVVHATEFDFTDNSYIQYRRGAGDYTSLLIDVLKDWTANVDICICSIKPGTAAAGDGEIYSPLSGHGAHAFAAYKVAGLDSTPFDKSATGLGSDQIPSSGATATTSQSDELLVGGIGTEGPDGDAAGTWNGDTTDNNQRLGTTGSGAASNITVAAATKIVSATGTYTASKTGITSRDWVAAIATYKGVAPAGDTYPAGHGKSFQNTLVRM